MQICEYGCGQEAKYQFKNGKWCCSKSTNSCFGNRQKKREQLKGISLSIEHKKKLSEAKKGKEPWNKGKTGVYSKESLKLMSKATKGKNIGRIPWNKNKTYEELYGIKRAEYLKINHSKKLKKKFSGKNNPSFLTIKKIKTRYPFFSQVEEMRYNPDKPEEKEIQVHCKNHLCPNSKERGGWFTPTYIQFYERIRQLEKESGNGGSYFYCSEKCKEICPLYRLRSDPLKETETPYTQEEYQQFREFVLKQDNYECQYCGEKATEIHHERPQKLEPFFALDPDLAWSVCESCHYKYGHKTGTECSTGNLANNMCLGV
jgi:5-methylcytosine-specific restriction endonuclease McrA